MKATISRVPKTKMIRLDYKNNYMYFKSIDEAYDHARNRLKVPVVEILGDKKE